MAEFSYEQAFDRNIGWVTEWEQQALRGKRIAIAGLGGVGGVHLLTLSRLGIGAFNLADFDTFDIVNFNRQVGATMATVGHPKLEVMMKMARAINPELLIKSFPEGITKFNVDEFLESADLYVDGLDFFVLDIRRAIFARCSQLGIPTITAAPIGMGSSWISFMPGGMTFEEYFRLEGQPQSEQYLRFLMGMAPRGLHRSYLVDPSRVDLSGKKGPSTAAACQLCSGIVGVAAVKLLLGRSGVHAAPYHHHFDPYIGRLCITKLPYGMNGPIQRAKLAIARRVYLRRSNETASTSPETGRATPIERILTLARWAPSGDNGQPWRFEITGEDSVNVHVTHEPAGNPYEYRNGEPTFISIGILMETMRIVASRQGRGMEWSMARDTLSPRFAISFPLVSGMDTDPLEAFVTLRSVDRRPYRRQPLTLREKSKLESAVASDLALRWFEDAGQRWRIARIGTRVTDIRLRAPEAFAVHQRVIDWSNKHSRTGVPAGAIGLDRATLVLMRWAMRSWNRMDRLNRTLGTRGVTTQLDLLPALRSSGFVAMMPHVKERPLSREALVRAGQAVQRFWLTATQLGLAIQPSLATLMIAHYGKEDMPFTEDRSLREKAHKLAADFCKFFGGLPDDYLFLARIGRPPPRMPGPRSIRRHLAELEIFSNSPTSATAAALTDSAQFDDDTPPFPIA